MAARHLEDEGLALYDLSSSYFEELHCPLGKLGYCRDGKRGKLQVNYGLLTNRAGVPVSAHIFLSMLAYYVQFHMMEAWRPVLFADEDPAAKASRDPVAPAQRSQGALDMAATKRLPDASLVHSFHTLLDELQTIVRNTCRPSGAADEEPTFHMLTPPSHKQQRAYDLLNAFAL